jgi:superfamily II DNA/RNA helicase
VKGVFERISSVLTPTRELAYQIAEQFEALGASIGVKVGKLSSKYT